VKQRRLLVTGGAGFIGTNFVHYWCQQHPTDWLMVLDKLTYAGNRASLESLIQTEKIQFVQGDICNRSLLTSLLTHHAIDTLVHFAAESHVDRSILEPGTFVQTNVMGTFTLLEAFRQHWASQHSADHFRFLHISTDEVFGSLGPTDPSFSETTPYAPNSPYSASKAGSDHLVRAYFHTYGLPTLITNCSNNYGPYQFPEKLIPLMCVNLLLGKPLPIYGDGQNIRDWLYVEDHCRALDVVLNRAKPGETYAIGGQSEIKNLDLVQLLCDVMDELADDLPVRPSQKLITLVRDRPGHDRRYAMNITKIQQTLGWSPAVTLKAGLRQTITWYLTHRHWWMPLLSTEYQAFYSALYEQR
jgi:dTDP-glucose 4,6-dehydratase